MGRLIEDEGEITEAFATAHSKTVTVYTSRYFQGLSRFSASTSNRFGGSLDAMAFLPLSVTVLGRLLENRGRIKPCKRYSTINAGLLVWLASADKKAVVIAARLESVQGSRDEYAMAARRTQKSRA